MKFLKESLHKFTIRRSQGLDSKSTYECVYKVDVHREHDIINDRSYGENIPTCMATDGGILLIILLQWEELLPGVGRFMPKPLSRAFYVSEKQTIMMTNKEDALRDIISSTIFRLGITSAEEKDSVTGLLASSIISMYNKSKDIYDHRYPSGWTPVVLDIVPERRVSSEEMGWANTEVDRFCLSYMSAKKKSTASADGDGAAEIEEEDCCSICMRGGKEDPCQSEFIKLPSCSHSYHKDCIVQWLTRTGQNRDHKDFISGWQRLTKTKNCPLCRTPVPPTSLADECPWQCKPGFWMRRFLK